jgi:hypothetical protein
MVELRQLPDHPRRRQGITNQGEAPMKKFLMLAYGYEEPTPDVMQAWGAWFAKVGDRFLDSGSPLGAGLQVTTSGSTDLSGDASPITGYSILSAESLEEAEQLLEGLPIIDSVRLYEARSM